MTLWEERWHPLREEWVVIAAHRQDRPWSGSTAPAPPEELSSYDKDCYLCPGNARVKGRRNPDYTGVFTFDNDHPCVGIDAPHDLDAPEGIHRVRPAEGIARVICYSPKHDVTLAQLEVREIEDLIAAWGEQYRDLGGRPEINHVLIFENKGKAVGTSNPHPHCQVYGTNFVFKTMEIEAQACRRHLEETGRILFQDIIEAEEKDGRRVLCENENAVAFVPYFARYAYEVYVAPRTTHAGASDLSDGERRGLAQVLKEVLIRFDNLWRMPFPYVMPLHQAPTDGNDHRGFHFHIEIHPPLRKPDLLKYLAGPEIGGGNFLSDTSPEEKAAELKQQANAHYKGD